MYPGLGVDVGGGVASSCSERRASKGACDQEMRRLLPETRVGGQINPGRDVHLATSIADASGVGVFGTWGALGVFLWLQHAYSSCEYPLFPTL